MERTATSTLTQLLSSEILNFSFQCSFTSTETIRLIRDGEPWAAASTFTQLMSSEIASFEFSISLRPETIRLIRVQYFFTSRDHKAY